MKTRLSPAALLRAACLTAFVSVAALSVSAQSQPLPGMPGSFPKPASPPDGEKNVDTSPLPNRKSERFISKVSILQSEENQISSIASRRASSEQLRTYAEQVQADNRAREQELSQLAQSRSVLIPTGRDAGAMANEGEEWRNKDTRDFDEDYVNRIIRIQRNSIEALEEYAKDADSDPELSAFAQKHLPTLRENLRQAEALEKQIG